MEYQVRPTKPDDLEDLFRIEIHPLVRAQQYPLGKRNSVERWREQLFGMDYRGAFTHGTLLVDGRIGGYIGRIFAPYCGRIRAIIGWNLDPALWGRGIMPAVLKGEFARLFVDPRLGEVEIDCFHDNTRCIRVLQKIGCRRTFVNPLDRIFSMIQHRCPRWIVRHRMTREMWQATSTATNDEVAGTLRVP